MSHVCINANRKVEVSYPTRRAQQAITRAEYDMVRVHPNVVLAIKFIRDQYGLGLYEAKQVVDTIRIEAMV